MILFKYNIIIIIYTSSYRGWIIEHSKYIFKQESEIYFLELLNPFFNVINNVSIIIILLLLLLSVVVIDDDAILTNIHKNGYIIEDFIELILHNISERVDSLIISLLLLLLCNEILLNV